ncbi:hypothetical protein NQ315_015959 [Exocentrus adspersus]|uniref:Tyr recombinase domain-containing protein n=1 Tax=Exocentrus adspersus TaxID=1586481 RepID=A0AAV8VK60_9CUCU|nr:hypothetical protein NQ315_015959 [Exocentrus adspersus]
MENFELEDAVKEVMDGILPKKSRKIYEARYDTFVKNGAVRENWKMSTKMFYLCFFAEKSKTLSSSTLWAHYSMLKTMLNVKRNIDVALIFGVAGACRGKELHQLTISDVTDMDHALLVNVRNTKNNVDQSSASLLADSGASIDVWKRHGGWKSASVAEGYIENSINTKKIVADSIFGLGVGNSTESASAHQVSGSAVSASSASSTSSKNNILQNTIDGANRLLNIVNCSNVNIHVNINTNNKDL